MSRTDFEVVTRLGAAIRTFDTVEKAIDAAERLGWSEDNPHGFPGLTVRSVTYREPERRVVWPPEKVAPAQPNAPALKLIGGRR